MFGRKKAPISENAVLKVKAHRCPQNHPCPSVRVCPVGALSQEGFAAPSNHRQGLIFRVNTEARTSTVW